MHVLCCELVLFVVLLNAALFFGFDALQERSVIAWMNGLGGTALDEALTQAQEHVAKTATSVTTDNVEGLVYYIQENYEASLRSFESACIRSNYMDETIINNWLLARQHVTSDSLVVKLRDLVFQYPGSTPLQQELVNEIRKDESQQTFSVSQELVRRLPWHYSLWLLFVDLHMRNHFINGGKATGTADAFSSEAELVQYGLTMFPRSPELNLVRAIHLVLKDDVACAAYFMYMANAHRNLDQGVLWPKYYQQVISLLSSKEGSLDLGYASEHCVPYMGHHDVSGYQKLHRTTADVAGEGWSNLYNVSAPPGIGLVINDLVSSSISVLLDRTGTPTAYLPSLQVGCNNVDACAMPGFLVADAMSSPSTHFLTQAYNLSMVADASVGLVYSSHTLEHLSHSLPPPSCHADGGTGEAAAGSRPRHSGCESELGASLTEWRRVLVPGGRLLVSVPDFARLAAKWANPGTSAQDRRFLVGFIFGGQIDEYDFHKVAFYPEMLWELLTSHGFCNITRVQKFSLFHDASEMDLISLSVHAVAC
jgi:predicted SAM-dependent methyltransferase